MKKTSDKSTSPAFRCGFRGYKRKEVDAYLAYVEQEHITALEDLQARIALLVQENERASQMIHELEEDKAHSESDREEYCRRLKEQGETINSLYDRLDLLGGETERLQTALTDLKKSVNRDDPTAEQWKQRALTAEETVRRLAEAEVREDKARDSGHSIRLPLGKKAYLDLTLHKDDLSV